MLVMRTGKRHSSHKHVDIRCFWQVALSGAWHSTVLNFLMSLSDLLKMFLTVEMLSGLILTKNCFRMMHFQKISSVSSVVFTKSTHSNQTSDSSWWPKHASCLNVGYWSVKCKTWFQMQLNAIWNGTAHLRIAAVSQALEGYGTIHC